MTRPGALAVDREPPDGTGSGSPVWGLLGSPAALAVRGGEDAEHTRVLWLTRLRWVAIAGQLAVLAPALAQGWLEPSLVPVFAGTVAALTAFNILCVVRLRQPRTTIGGALLHLAVDLVALTVLLALSGGAWNPFAPIFFIHAALGALILNGRRSVALATLLVGVTVVINVFPVMPPAMPARPTPVAVMLPTQVLIALVVWAMTGWLAAGLAAQGKLLQNLRDHQGRIDRLRATGALAAGFSHQFSTPLNTLKLRLDRIERRDLGEAVDKDVDAARQAADKCEEVLRGMVGRQLDPKEMRLEDVEVAALCERVMASWSSSGHGREVRLVITGAKDLRCRLPPLPFTQALLDLLDNAGEASDGEIVVRVHCAGGACRIAVEDRGPGWPDVVRANLGQPFLTTKGTGTGLGLYNAHSLAVALGGELVLDDNEGGGAIAVVNIPCTEMPGEVR